MNPSTPPMQAAGPGGSQLTQSQLEWVASLARRLGAIPGVRSVVLGGSYARGRARPDSDIDLGIFYSEAAPFPIQRIREVAEDVNDRPGPVVTRFNDWGPWVNGGAWLTIAGQRVDVLYRSLDLCERVIGDAEAGRYEVHHLQQPPFGFFSPIYLGEIAVCHPLFDPESRLDSLKERVACYPEALRQAVVRDYLFMAEFNLTSFAPKCAARGDVHGTAACLTRAVHEVIMVLFALNRTYLVNDKTALEEVGGFVKAPRDFGSRVQQSMARMGAAPGELTATVEKVRQMLRETIELAGTLYSPRCLLPPSPATTEPKP